MRERLAGYRKALEEAQLPYQPELVRFGSYERKFGQLAATELLALPQPPTAVFAASDYLAVGMLETLRGQGLDVPGYMSIVGFDDMEFASLLMPPRSTLRQSARDLGRTGVATLLGLLDGSSAAALGPATVQRLPVQLVQRASVAAPRNQS